MKNKPLSHCILKPNTVIVKKEAIVQPENAAWRGVSKQNSALPSPPSLPLPPLLTSAPVQGWVIFPWGDSVTDLGNGALWATFTSYGYKIQPRNWGLIGWQIFGRYTTKESTFAEITSVLPRSCAPGSQKVKAYLIGSSRAGLSEVAWMCSVSKNA